MHQEELTASLISQLPHPTPHPQGQRAVAELDSQLGDGPQQPTPHPPQQESLRPENERTDQPPVPGQLQGYDPNQRPPYQGYGPNDGYYQGRREGGESDM